ncbi:putative ATPase [Bosea sp. BE125]|uniref:AAA family ATPase n=1 Tax=Bosea sp. BE125 TaxID=2817909 RepID=UPI00286063CE|nr:AAA family ATPase [Bosea sp. BE125]MDR6869560.1 putative ATPase [Bosea sp. BE125]
MIALTFTVAISPRHRKSSAGPERAFCTQKVRRHALLYSHHFAGLNPAGGSPLIHFHVIPRSGNFPSEGKNAAYLKIDHWNDYSFVTMFEVVIFDENSARHDLGNVKVGFQDQTESTSTFSTLTPDFKELGPSYFSVGLDIDYYLTLSRKVSREFCDFYLGSLRDVAHDDAVLQFAAGEKVFQVSHLRSLSINTVVDQFRRVLSGGAPLTDYSFRFTQDEGERRAGYVLDFEVKAGSTPSTNIHAIIGRNGVGKTTLLNNMTKSIALQNNPDSRFETSSWFQYDVISSDYFSGLVSISFSAFDPFNPPEEQSDPSKGTCYFYVGLKNYADDSGALLKSQNDLSDELIESLAICLSEPSRNLRWVEAIRNLESDDNFAEMNLTQLSELRGESLEQLARSLLKRMSSGHAIVLLTITKLVARVDEKTLVLFDEPESHLHPPLLSALVRSLGRLLSNRNAIAILATHSPVVLQEVPRSCVWKITRSGLSSAWQRPETETFGENVGLLTREVFGLEVSKSGFNALLISEADRSRTYEDVLATFNDQLGFEGRAILRSIMHRAERQ